MSKAFDTINIHTLIRELLQTNIPEEKNIVYLICMNWNNVYDSYQHSVFCTFVIAMKTYIFSFICVFHVLSE